MIKVTHSFELHWNESACRKEVRLGMEQVIYANALEILSSNTTPYEDIIFIVLGTYTRYPFWCSGIPTKIPRNPFCAWWCIFNAFVSIYAVDFRTTHGQNNTHKCDTEGFVPVASLCGVVVSPSSFMRCLVGRTSCHPT